MDAIRSILGLEAGDADWLALLRVGELVAGCEAVAACRVRAEGELGVLRVATGALLRERMVADGFGEDVVAAAVRGYVQEPVAVLQVVYGVADIVAGANPYGCNQYGEGWAEEHDGNSTKYEVTGFSGKKSKMLINKQGGNTVEVATKEKKVGKDAYPDASERGLKKEADKAAEENAKKVEENKPKKKRYFEPAKTLKEAKANTASLVGGDLKKVTWGKYMTLEQINEYNEVMAEMYEKYPLKVEVAKLGSYSKFGSEGAHNKWKLWLNSGKVTVETQINQDSGVTGCHRFKTGWKSYAKPDSMGYTRHNVGATPDGISIKAVMTHEHGHAIHSLVAAYAKNSNKVNADKKLVADCVAAQNKLTEAYNRALKDGDMKKISRYARTDTAEFFAECFAARELGEELPDYINSALDNVIKIGIKKS